MIWIDIGGPSTWRRRPDGPALTSAGASTRALRRPNAWPAGRWIANVEPSSGRSGQRTPWSVDQSATASRASSRRPPEANAPPVA
eukprot:scaffold456159_cov20-Prasinocladus_malaysianus.AAC.2